MVIIIIILLLLLLLLLKSRNGLRSVLFTRDWNYTIHVRLDEAVLL